MMLDLRLIENGYLHVGVVGYSENKQKEIMEAFKGLNFQSVVGYKSFSALKEDVLKGRIQWVFSTPKDAYDINLEQFMEEVYEKLELMPLVFSVLINYNDLRQLPALFACGLFTWHPDKGVPEYTRQSLWRLKRKISQVHGIGPLISYLFFRTYLKEKNLWQEMTVLCENMIKYFPYEDLIKAHLLEAYICSGQKAKSEALLHNLENFEQVSSVRLTELRKHLLSAAKPTISHLSERYNFTTALVVHANKTQRYMLQDILQQFGFKNILLCQDGQQAWEHITKEKIDFTIIDWNCENLSAANLLQRIRLCGYWEFPIIVQANNLKPSEIQLIKLYGVACCVPNVSNQFFHKMVISWNLVQGKEPSEAQGIERKVLERLGVRDVPRAIRYFEKYLRVASRDPGKEKLLLAQIEMAKGNYLDARYLLLEARNETKVNIVKVDTMIAQCLFALGDYAGVISLLKRIKKHAVNMIEVDTLLARSHLRIGDLTSAMRIVNEEAQIDGEHPWVLRVMAKAFALNENLDRVDQISHKINMAISIRDCLNLGRVYCNNDALFQKGVNLYRTCLDLCEKYDKPLKDTVELNLAIAYIFDRKLDLAIAHFEQVAEVSEQLKMVYEKVQEFLGEPSAKVPEFKFISFERVADFRENYLKKHEIELVETPTVSKDSSLLFLRGIFPKHKAA